MSSNCTGSGEPSHQNGYNGQNNGSNDGSPKKTYTLSANAPVFVPKFTMPPQQPPPPQQQQLNYPHPPRTLFVDRDMPSQVHYTSEAFIEDDSNRSYESELEEFERMLVIQQSSSGLKCNGSPVQMFEEAVVTLTTKGNVEEYMKPILSKLKNGPTDMAIITDMINILYDHSIKETNFGYTGAQICKYLANELKNHQPFGNFRELFLAKCKRAYDEREAWVADPVTFTHLTNLSMLIGHLFLVLEVEVNGQLEKLGFLRQAISSLLLTFLAQPDDDRIKSAAQLLKLTGFELTKNSHLPGEFEETYNIIRSLEKHPSLNRTSHCLINSVLSRVDHNWGVDQVS